METFLLWVIATMTTVAAGASVFGTWLTHRNHELIKTDEGLTIGQHIERLESDLAEVADAKLLADARLASAALVAVAKLAKATAEDADLTSQARRTATEILAKADQAATDMLEAKSGEEVLRAAANADQVTSDLAATDPKKLRKDPST